MKKDWQNIKRRNRIRVDSQAIGINLRGGEDDTVCRSFTNCQRRVSVSQGSGYGSSAEQSDDDRDDGDSVQQVQFVGGQSQLAEKENGKRFFALFEGGEVQPERCDECVCQDAEAEL
jgi:hypothetical protein